MSTSSPRFKRTPPQQSHPHRNPAGAPQDGEPGGRQSGVLESAVRSAYTVIDEYMRRGCEAASMHQPPYPWSDPMNPDPNQQQQHQQYYQNGWGNPWGPGMGPGMGMGMGMAAPTLVAQLAQAYQTWMALAYGATRGMGGMNGMGAAPGWEPWGNGMGPQSPFGPAGVAPDTAGPAPTTSRVPSVSIKVAFDRPTEVIPNIVAGNAGTRLEVEPLTSSDGKLPAITGTFAAFDESGRLIVRVTPMSDAPAGEYSGVVKDNNGRPIGGITVILS